MYKRQSNCYNIFKIILVWSAAEKITDKKIY